MRKTANTSLEIYHPLIVTCMHFKIAVLEEQNRKKNVETYKNAHS